MPASCCVGSSSVWPPVSPTLFPLCFSSGAPALCRLPWGPLCLARGQPRPPSCRKCPHTLQPDAAPLLPPKLFADIADGLHPCVSSTGWRPGTEPHLCPQHPHKTKSVVGICGYLTSRMATSLFLVKEGMGTWSDHSEILPQMIASGSHAFSRSCAAGDIPGPPPTQT